MTTPTAQIIRTVTYKARADLGKLRTSSQGDKIDVRFWEDDQNKTAVFFGILTVTSGAEDHGKRSAKVRGRLISDGVERRAHILWTPRTGQVGKLRITLQIY